MVASVGNVRVLSPQEKYPARRVVLEPWPDLNPALTKYTVCIGNFGQEMIAGIQAERMEQFIPSSFLWLLAKSHEQFGKCRRRSRSAHFSALRPVRDIEESFQMTRQRIRPCVPKVGNSSGTLRQVSGCLFADEEI